MKKIRKLADQFNTILAKHEFLLRFNGNNELIISGAPTNNLLSRLFFSITGIILVTVCLVQGVENGNTIVIGGCLLGLILTATPFISFHSKKSFKVYISRRMKQINIDHGTFHPYKRIDFSSIEAVYLSKTRTEDLSSTNPDLPVIFNYSFSVMVKEKKVVLFSMTSPDPTILVFATDFNRFLAEFMEKPLKSDA